MNCKTNTYQSRFLVKVERRQVTSDELRNILKASPRDAARCVLVAAESGMPGAQIVYGQMLLDGQGVDRDHVGAFMWFEKATKSGDPEALNMIGRCYEQGWGVEQNMTLATEFFEKASKYGHLWGQVNFAQMLMRRNDPDNFSRCISMFHNAAVVGSGKAQLKAMNSLARMLEEGWGCNADPERAAFWYIQAARRGDHWAQYNIFTILYKKNKKQEAISWLKNAISISDNGFRRRIAALLLARPEEDLRRQGLDALALCAEGKLPEDLYAYAVALNDGVAGSPEPLKALLFFREAASAGHPKATLHLVQSSKPQNAYSFLRVMNAAIHRLPFFA
ncbi:tetratricopeptide repeat protein [Acetobacter sp. DmW_043]|uniref:tetratricopeptide repeat protein n=1 Tax=Acetobacter sp. DmW_043 TaxID=1670658 RepID=UPI000A394A52|nr:tetratricopeptide repeat protein [Acetobacter sp. DmW_043]